MADQHAGTRIREQVRTHYAAAATAVTAGAGTGCCPGAGISCCATHLAEQPGPGAARYTAAERDQLPPGAVAASLGSGSTTPLRTATGDSDPGTEAQMGEQPAIRAEGLHKRFGAVTALAGADLQVPAGGVVAVLGPNGAGKTTLVRILSTLLPPDAGRAWVAGLDVVRQAAAVRQLIGLSGQYAAVDGYLTGRENLHMIGRLSGLRRAAARRRADELLDLFDLTGAARRTARTYSGGMRRRLDVAASLVAAPPVLFLDEPTTGLDPRGRFGLWTLLGELAAGGTSLLLTTQYLEEADRLADTIVVIDAGRVIAAGTAEALKARIGGDRLELQARPGDDPRPLAAALAGLGSGPAAVHAETGTVILPVTDGPGILPDVATRLAANNLRVADLALRRPTLDDVFLTLTGQAAAPPAQADPAGQQRGGRDAAAARTA